MWLRKKKGRYFLLQVSAKHWGDSDFCAYSTVLFVYKIHHKITAEATLRHYFSDREKKMQRADCGCNHLARRNTSLKNRKTPIWTGYIVNVNAKFQYCNLSWRSHPLWRASASHKEYIQYTMNREYIPYAVYRTPHHHSHAWLSWHYSQVPKVRNKVWWGGIPNGPPN